jgi:hypothetical protein
VISENNRLPKTLAGLFGIAGSLYVRRAPLYLALALVAFAVQFVVDVLLPFDLGLALGLSIVLEAFVFAAVSIGVAFDLAGKAADWSTVLVAASERWGAVACVGLVYQFVFLYLEPNVIGPPDQTFYGLLIPPIIVFWGAISLAQVVAAIEPVTSRLTLPLLALGKGMAVGLRWANLGRLLLLSMIIVLPAVIENALTVVLGQHHVRSADFWGAVPFDSVVIGPVQALSTVFYIDFLRRARS